MRKKSKIGRTAAAVAAGLAVLIFLTGCLTTETNIIVKPDGSGRFEQTILMKQEFVDMIAGFKGDENYSLLNEEELRGDTSQYGEGVRFVSAEKIASGGYSGYKAVYSFENIEDITLNQNPGDSLPEEASGENSEEELIHFTFDRGNPSTLTLYMPASTDDFNSAEMSDKDFNDADSQEFLEAFNKIYKDMKMEMKLTIDGRITRTNASYRDGNTITLFDIDFSSIAGNNDIIQKMSRVQPETMEELKSFMETVPGMKAELQEEVVVTFR